MVSMSNKPSFYLKKIRNYRRAHFVAGRGGKCKICSYDRCIDALIFHHRDPRTKLFKISGINLSNKKIEILKAEISKCDLLCANCHAEIHALK